MSDAVAKHNARVLAVAQALGGASPAIVISLARPRRPGASRPTRASPRSRSACSSSASPPARFRRRS